MHKLIW